MKLYSYGRVFDVMIIEGVRMPRKRTKGMEGLKMNKVSHDRKQGGLYWGKMPLPAGGEIIGTVTRASGESGALIKMPGGVLVQGNHGAIRMLNHNKGRMVL